MKYVYNSKYGTFEAVVNPPHCEGNTQALTISDVLDLLNGDDYEDLAADMGYLKK